MEAIGAVASLITLLDIARKLSTDAWEISQAIHQAPAEIQDAADEVGLLGSILEQVLELALEMEDGCHLSPHSQANFARALRQCRRNLNKLQELCGLERDGAKFRQRLKWALVERKQVDKAKDQIAHAARYLLMMIDTLNL